MEGYTNQNNLSGKQLAHQGMSWINNKNAHNQSDSDTFGILWKTF